MAVTRDTPAPYAPPSAILEIINRYRSRGLQSPVNVEVLGRAGISESLISRTLQALQSLDLIDDEGRPTDTLEGLRLAPEAEFKERMAQWLNAAYADVLNFVDPSQDDETRVRDAFRAYRPVGQQDRMVTLFTGLYTAAGVMPEKQTQPRKPRTTLLTAGRTSTARSKTPSTRRTPSTTHDPAGLPAAISGLLASLPAPEIGWTQTQRDKFVATFGTVLDFCYPIIEAQTATNIEDEE